MGILNPTETEAENPIQPGQDRPAPRIQVSIGVGGQYLSLSGNDFENVDAAVGFAGSLYYAVSASVRIGASVQYGSHSSQVVDVIVDPDFGTFYVGMDDNIGFLGILGEAQYLFGGSGKVTPYVAARLGWAKASASDFELFVFDEFGDPLGSFREAS